MALMQRIEEVRVAQEEQRVVRDEQNRSKCDFCGKTHTNAEVEDKELLHFYSDSGILFGFGVIGQNVNDSAFFHEDDPEDIPWVN